LSGVTSSDDSRIEIEILLDEFYAAPIGHSQLGEFEAVNSVPAPYDSLLDHHEHMTVTVESHYGQRLGVHVHRCVKEGNWYSREITLVTSHSRRIVQYGIVRLDTSTLQPEVWTEIESRHIPLGRVLIDHDVLREVQMCELWRVQAGPSLASLMHLRIGDVLYGRTALIFCDGAPAIELLEIVAPTTAEERP
jgi:chorismate-pyruvate lyase